MIQKLLGLLVGYTGVSGLGFFIFKQKYYECLYLTAFMYVLSKMIGGSQHNSLYTLFGFICKPFIHIDGYVKEGYESVKKEFEKNFYQGMEQGAQLTVYVKGEQVVNLTGIADTYSYDSKSMQIIYSSSKSIVAIVVAMLVDRGLIKYEEKVCKYWPEFGRNGKQDITVQDVLKHEARLPEITPAVTHMHVSRQQIYKNEVGAVIENQQPKSIDKKNPREYHASSRGLILNEIVRRVDPKKRTIGIIIEEEIAGPMQLELYCGVPDHKLIKVKQDYLTMKKQKLWTFLQGFVPSFMGRKINFNVIIMAFIYKMMGKIQDGKDAVKFDHILFKKGEHPSISMTANSEAMAKLANIMAMGGEADGIKLMSDKTVNLAHSDGTVQNMINSSTKFSKGGFHIYDKDVKCGTDFDCEGFVGWHGFGGSLLNWHREQQIGFAYAMNLLDADISNLKAFRLRAAVFKAVQKINSNSKKNI